MYHKYIFCIMNNNSNRKLSLTGIDNISHTLKYHSCYFDYIISIHV